MRRALLLGCVVLAACNGVTQPGEDGVDGGTRGDGGVDAGSTLQPAPMGGGFCCPVDTPGCGCFRTGGWVATDDASKCLAPCDVAPPYTTKLDDHGCEVVETTLNSCLTIPRG